MSESCYFPSAAAMAARASVTCSYRLVTADTVDVKDLALVARLAVCVLVAHVRFLLYPAWSLKRQLSRAWVQ